MKFWGRLIELLDADMQTPEMYGWFHLTFFTLSIVAGLLLCRFRSRPDEQYVRRLLTATGIVVLILEVYKQINFTFSYDGAVITADYQWYAFPFQFCSTPMFVSILASLIRNRRIHSSLCAYLGSFALFAGFAVMFYPATVFIPTIGINIQTMICHGSMITVGIYLLGTGYVKTEHKTILKAIPVFCICVILAVIMNEAAYYLGLLETDSFNMFYISRHCEPSLPVYSLVQEAVAYPWCLFIYVAGFSAAAYIILLIAMLIKRCRISLKERRIAI